MTAKLDGTNGLIQQYDYQTPSTGFSYTFAAGTTNLVMNPAGTLATGTITMPATPADGMTISISSTQQVTAVTVQGNTGQSLVGAPVQLIPNQPLAFIYRLSNTTWYPMVGGAGRASDLVSGTAVASTSGTSITFSSIPSWAKRITVMFNGVSTNGSSAILVQIGSGSVTTSGYLASGASGGTTLTTSSFTTGFGINSVNAANVISGIATLALITSNTWCFSASLGYTSTNAMLLSGGNSPALSGALDRVVITTVNGTDTFDAGSINILYE